MVEVLISEGALVLALGAVLVAHLKTRRLEDSAVSREQLYREYIAKQTKEVLCEALALKNAEAERLKERLTTLLRMAPEIESLVDTARELNMARGALRGVEGPRSVMTSGHNTYNREDIPG